MLNLKKTAAAVLALGSSAVFAGTMGPVCSAVNVTIPCESTAWDVGGEALYLQGTTSNTGFSYVGINDQGNSVSTDQWGWGFWLEASYHYETGSDANLNWYHWSKSSTKSMTNTGEIAGGTGVSRVRSIDGTATTTLDYDPKWDAVNLEFGQHVDFGEKKDIRFHAGVQYARIAATVNKSILASGTVVTSEGTSTVDGGTFDTSRKPTFNGFGPRVGADMGYAWGNGLGVYGNGALALLAGSSKQSFSESSNIIAPLSLSVSRASVVPEVEAKLGIKYDYAVAQGDLTLDAGWMWINYFSPIQSATSRGVGPGLETSDGNFGLQGVYFGLKWVGNVA